jgi:dolichol-phosphate mannosyltransferase
MNNTALLLRLPLLALLVDVLHVNYLVGNVSVLVVLFLARFVVSDRLIFRGGCR